MTLFRTLACSIALTSIAITATAASTAGSVADYPDIARYVSGAQRPASAPEFQYTADGTGYLSLSDDHSRIIRYDVKTGKEVETVMDLTKARETTDLRRIEGFRFSPDGRQIMVWTDSRPIYRRSSTAKYYVYELHSRLLRPLSTQHQRQQSPVFSPDGRMVAFVADNNIYIKKLDYNSEVAVTKDGEKNRIINGVPDWTYEEEFSTNCSMAWAPDNLTLCFIKYNETDVRPFTFMMYEGTCDPIEEYALYPGQYTYKYPVAGQQNSKVSVHAYDVETRKLTQLTLPDSKIEYIPRIEFGGSADRLMVTTLNREQDRMELYSVNPRSTVVRSLLVEQWNAWLSPVTYEDIHYYDNFFVVTSCRSGFDHLYAYSYAGALQRQLTSGQFDVTQYYGFDPATGCHYYQSTETGPLNRVISKVDAKGKVTRLTSAEGTSSAQSVSPTMSCFVLKYSNVQTPPTYTLVNARDAKPIRRLVENTGYAAKWADAPKAEFFTMESEGVTLNGYIIKPAGFEPSKRYPVIMSQYSGPGSQQVLNQWSIGAENYFAKAGYVVVCVDGRGTGGRGRQFMDVVYRRLGYYESIDQVAAANYAGRLPYVDPARIGIYGWSYGGYEAIMASSTQGAPYAAAVAVAPVTDWRYYDTVYAERYMLTPQANESGYDEASTLNKIRNRQCPLLIIHGTADDNVHLFNTISYSSHAEEIGRWTDVVLFPNKNHSIYGCNARETVYARLLNYFDRNMR